MWDAVSENMMDFIFIYLLTHSIYIPILQISSEQSAKSVKQRVKTSPAEKNITSPPPKKTLSGINRNPSLYSSVFTGHLKTTRARTRLASLGRLLNNGEQPRRRFSSSMCPPSVPQPQVGEGETPRMSLTHVEEGSPSGTNPRLYRT